jgi:hypothetical protein
MPTSWRRFLNRWCPRLRSGVRWISVESMCRRVRCNATVEGSAVVGALSDDIARAAEPSGAKRATLGRIAELLERNGIDVDEVGAVRRVSLYQQVTKGP